MCASQVRYSMCIGGKTSTSHAPPMDTETSNLLTALKALRDSCTNDQWDKLTESGPLAELIDACCDLEYAVEGE